MRNTEIRQLTNKELIDKLNDESDTMNRLRLNHAVSALENPMKLKHTRRLIAKLKTELHTRQSAGNFQIEGV